MNTPFSVDIAAQTPTTTDDVAINTAPFAADMAPASYWTNRIAEERGDTAQATGADNRNGADPSYLESSQAQSLEIPAEAKLDPPGQDVVQALGIEEQQRGYWQDLVARRATERQVGLRNRGGRSTGRARA